MKRLLPMVLVLLPAPASAEAARVQPQARQCWLDAMSDAEKRALVLEYARVQHAEGKARADAWAQEQKAAYGRRSVAKGVCPPDTASAQAPTPPARAPQPDKRPLNRYGQPCKRLELENQNVPNVGGSMGWALVQVCKD
ncbi:MAG: hypothetical protein ABW023_06095 [Sphingomonas sp.]